MKRESEGRNGSLRSAATVLAVMFALCAAAPSHARCTEGNTRACTAENGCPGVETCDGNRFGECQASACFAPRVSFQTAGMGSGREVYVGASSEYGEPSTSQIPVYLFTKAQRQVVFTATGMTTNSGVASVKLSGTMVVTCSERRINPSTLERRYVTSTPLSSVSAPPQSQSSLSTSLVVNFLPFIEEYRCPSGYLPWKQELSIHAEATNAAGMTAYTERKSFIFMQSFKVATYNILDGKNVEEQDTLNLIAAHLHQNDVDVALLQEAKIKTVDRLRKSPFIGRLNTAVRESGDDEESEDLAIFSKFPIVDHQIFKHTRPVSGYDYRWHYVKLDLGGFPLKLANVHFIATSVADHRDIDEVAHRRSNVEDVMAHMANPGVPALIAGDVNTTVYAPGTGYSVYNYQIQPLAHSFPYRHVCDLTGCPASGDNESRYNFDQIWIWYNTPGLLAVDAYLASTTGAEPSNHRMQVSRLVLKESP